MQTQFGPFEIVRPLGQGGMAETSLAIRRGNDGFERRVCLKRILPEHNTRAEFVTAFQHEARLAVHLVHPHIAQLYEFGAFEGTWWMSMEYVGGGDLRGLLTTLGQPLPVDLALQLTVDLASALLYAHELAIDGRPANIVHRDVSPSNVLLDEHGNFKLADFGIAKTTLGEGTTRTGTVKGKAAYMAPEQALGQMVDRRADLWALGVVLYEALAGVRPFEGPNELATMYKATRGERKPLVELAPHVPRVVAGVVEKLLAVDVRARFASAGDVLDALADHPPPTNARRRLAELLRRLRNGPSSEVPVPREPTELITATPNLVGPEPIPSNPRDVTRTSTSVRPELEPETERTAPPEVIPTTRTQPAAPEAPVSVSTTPFVAEVAPSPSSRSVARSRAAMGVAASLAFTVVGAYVAAQLAGPRTEPAAAPPVVAPATAAPATAAPVTAAPVTAVPGAPASGTAAVGTAAPSTAAPVVAAPVVAAPVVAAPVVAAPPPGAAVSEASPLPSGVAPPAVGSGASPAVADPAVPRGAEPPPLPDVAATAPREAADPEPARSETARGTRPAGPRRPGRTGSVRVVIMPWGRVWIDGRSLGRAPLVSEVSEGAHTIGAGRDTVSQTRRVVVRAGQTSEVEFQIEN